MVKLGPANSIIIVPRPKGCGALSLIQESKLLWLAVVDPRLEGIEISSADAAARWHATTVH
jgi:hypothetical protein